MAKQNVFSKQCPVCEFRPVEQIRGPKGFGSPTHRRPSCSALLKATLAARVLLAIPICAIALGIEYVCINWLKHSPELPGVIRAGLLGGIGAFGFAVALNSAARGFVFKPIESNGKHAK